MALVHCCPIVEDGVIDSVGSLANREREAATYCHFEHLFLLNRFKSSWMVTHFAISDSNFTIWVRAPDHSLVVCVDNDEEWATNIDAADKDVILQFDFPWPFEFSEYSRSPDVHLTIVCDSSGGVPSWNLLEVVWSRHLWALGVIWMPRVNPHRLELILIWIVTDLAKVVCSTCPKLTAPVFSVLCKE